MTSLRAQVRDLLQPLLPGFGFHISEDNLDAISKPTVIIRQRTIEPAPSAPGGAHLVTFLVQINTPTRAGFAKAEDALDEQVQALLTSLDALDHVAWTKAEKTLDPESKELSYFIDLTVVTRKA